MLNVIKQLVNMTQIRKEFETDEIYEEVWPSWILLSTFRQVRGGRRGGQATNRLSRLVQSAPPLKTPPPEFVLTMVLLGIGHNASYMLYAQLFTHEPHAANFSLKNSQSDQAAAPVHSKSIRKYHSTPMRSQS